MEKNIDPNAQEGMRIRLITMEDDFGAVDPQMEGTIRRIDDIGTLHVNWDDGRTLGVIPGVDEYVLLPPESEQTPVGTDIFEDSDGPITKRYNQEFKRITNTTKPKLELESDDKVEGGLADKLTVQDIAKKHKVPIGDIRKEIKKGIPVEMEHTKDRSKAKEIVMDHLTEFPDFYSNEKHGAIASEKALEKIHEDGGVSIKDEVQRILDTIKSTNFQQKDAVDNMIDNFYQKHKGKHKDEDKLTQIYTNLKNKLEAKFNVDEITAAGGGGSTGAFVGPLSTKKKNENKIIKKGDFITEIQRVNKLRHDGAYDGNSWVGDKDSDGWLFDDDPAWDGGEIIDILAKLDINWKDKNLSITTNESFQKGVKELVNEGWFEKSHEDNLLTNLFDRVKKQFPQDARTGSGSYSWDSDYIEFTIPSLRGQTEVRIFKKYYTGDIRDTYWVKINNRQLPASRRLIKKMYKYMYNIIERRDDDEDLRNIEADLSDPNFAQDVFDQLDESRLFKTKEDRLAMVILQRVKENWPDDASLMFNRVSFTLPGVERDPRIDVKYYNDDSYIKVNERTLDAGRWIIKKIYKYMRTKIEDWEEGRDFRRIQADLTDPDFAQDAFDQMNESFWNKPKKDRIEVGDGVKVTSFEGEPEGVVYDIRNGSYWVDLGKFGKMEFSDFELVKLNNTTNGGLIKEGENGALVFVVLFLSSILSQIPIKQWPQYFAENSRDMFTDFLKFMKRFGYDIDIDYVKNNFNSLIKKALGKLYKEGGVNQELDETTTFASALGDSGTYVTPAFAAAKGKHGPSKKPIWKGGTIVQDVKSDGVLVKETKIPYSGGDLEEKAKRTIKLNLNGETLKIGDSITFKRSQTILRRLFPQSYIIGEPYTNFKKNETYELTNIWTDYKLNNNDALLTILTDFKEDFAIEFMSGDKKLVVSYEDLKRLYDKNFFVIDNTVEINEINKVKLVKEDFDWVSDVETSFHVGDKIDTGKDVRKITDIDYDLSSSYQTIEYRSSLGFKSVMVSTAVKKHLESGEWRIIDEDTITEINKVKWVKDGKYVKLKEKCTKFNNQPWCNSGNASDPLELSDTTNENIDNISEKYNIPKEYILQKLKSGLNL
jgi:hypothetical protein